MKGSEGRDSPPFVRRPRTALHYFTLVEMLVVTAVLMVLASLALPAFHQSAELARAVVCQSNLKGMAYGYGLYLEDNAEQLVNSAKPYITDTKSWPLPEENIPGLNWFHTRWCNGDVNVRKRPDYASALVGYMGDARSFICPVFQRIAENTSEDHFYLQYKNLIKNYDPWYNYSANAYLGSDYKQQVADKKLSKDTWDQLKDPLFLRLRQVDDPAEVFSFAEESAKVDLTYNLSGLNDPCMIPGDLEMVLGWLKLPTVNWDFRRIEPGPTGVGPFWDVIAGFHFAQPDDPMGGWGHCAFLDGHVARHTRLETFSVCWPMRY